MASKKKVRTIKMRPLWEYIKKFYDSNFVWVEQEVMGMAGWEREDIAVYLDHPRHIASPYEICRTLTHELVHNVHPHPSWPAEDHKADEERNSWEAAVEKIEEALWADPVWQAVVANWLLEKQHRMIRYAREQGVAFS